MNNMDKLVLASKGLLEAPEEVTVRGMLGKEISTLFSSLTEAAVESIIKNVTEPSLDPSTLCDEDKKLILHKTRVLTFGNEVQQTLRCPYCSHIADYVLSYDDFTITNLDENYLTQEILINGFTVLKDKIIPRIPLKKHWDEINRHKEKVNLADNYAFILLQVAKIETINGKRLSVGQAIDYLENLPGKELIKLSKKLDIKFGIDTTFTVECVKCKTPFTGGVGINADLFREPDNTL